jgi:hypothetical protein
VEALEMSSNPLSVLNLGINITRVLKNNQRTGFGVNHSCKKMDYEKDETKTTGVEQMPILFVNKLRQLARLSEKLEETCMRPFSQFSEVHDTW